MAHVSAFLGELTPPSPPEIFGTRESICKRSRAAAFFEKPELGAARPKKDPRGQWSGTEGGFRGCTNDINMYPLSCPFPSRFSSLSSPLPTISRSEVMFWGCGCQATRRSYASPEGRDGSDRPDNTYGVLVSIAPIPATLPPPPPSRPLILFHLRSRTAILSAMRFGTPVSVCWRYSPFPLPLPFPFPFPFGQAGMIPDERYFVPDLPRNPYFSPVQV